MPTYEYVCEACGHAVEYFQSMTEGPKKKCPECGQLRLKRKISAGAGVVFKGGGFYETDYRSEAYKKDERAAKDAQSPPKATDGEKPSASKSDGAAKTKDKGKQPAGD